MDEEKAKNESAQEPEATETPDEGCLALEAALDEEKKRSAEYLDNWQRARADFANLRKRTEQEKAEIAKFANAELVRDLLSVSDDLERAMKSLPPSLRTFTWIEGVFIIHQKLLAILEREGLTPIEATGKDFDPVVHDAVQVEEGAEGGMEVVVEEYQRGYKLHDRVLRPSLVKVGRRESV